MEFRLLGPMEVEHAGVGASLGRRRERCLLGLLLLEPGTAMPARRLLDLLWDDEPPDTGLGQLRSNISRLRTRLKACGGGDATQIQTHGSGYSIHVDPERVDVHRFRRLLAEAADEPDDAVRAERLRAALALWRGPVLADVMTDQLRERVASGLAELRLSAFERLAEVDLRAGRAREVVTELTELTAQHPLRERLTALLMTAHVQTGSHAEASRAYHRMRERLAGELGLDPSAELRELHDRILRQNRTAEVSSGGATPVRPDPIGVPAQLPADIPHFTGRDEPLRRLDALLSSAGAGTGAVVISGTAGVGKTALAVHWAHRVRHRFPDGQLYVNLRGFDPSGTGMDPAEAVRSFLDTLGVPAPRIPAQLDAQAALYRTLLADKRMLVLLDNASDPDQVRPLLPGAGASLALITSRAQLTGLIVTEGAHLLPLDLLTPDEAGDLLTRRIGTARASAEPQAVEEISARCARLPLAVAVVGARASTLPHLPLAAIAADLREARHRLDVLTTGDTASDLRAVFSSSYRTLTADAARLFRLLGLHPGPEVAAPAAGSLAALPASRVGPLLVELTRAHLITEPAPGRYAFHDLLRSYARQLAEQSDPDDQRHAATQRVLDHYLHTAYGADRLLAPARDPVALPPAQPGVSQEVITDYGQAMAWFAAERAVLLAAVQHAADTGLDRYAAQLAWTLATYLNRRGHWHDYAATQQAAVAAARRVGDPAAQAHAHRLLAGAATRLGCYTDAQAHFRHALDLHERQGDLPGQANTQYNLGWLGTLQGRHEESLDHTRRAFDLYRAAGHDRGQADCLNAIGWLYAKLGEHRQALTCCQQSLALHQQIGNRHGQAETWDSLGYIHRHLGDHDESVACYERALTLRREFDDRYNEAVALTGLGDTRHSAGDRYAARDAWQQALTILQELDYPDAEEVRARLDRLRDPEPVAAVR
jgi:DNA-binding SARP family transcriptional activator/tetratricopeptide (TPR) repeat protein